MLIPNTETIIQGKKSNFTLEQLKNASKKDRPFYYPYRPDYSVTSNRVYEKPRHGENILSNSYKPPKLIIYQAQFQDQSFIGNVYLMVDAIQKQYDAIVISSKSIGNGDWKLIYEDNSETFLIMSGNQNYKTSTEMEYTRPYFKADGTQMMKTYRHSESIYLALNIGYYFYLELVITSRQNYYYGDVKISTDRNMLVNDGLILRNYYIDTSMKNLYREEDEIKNTRGPIILGGKNKEAIYKPSSFKNLPAIKIQRKSTKAHQVIIKYTFEDDGLTNFDINCGNFEEYQMKSLISDDSRLQKSKIPILENITDETVEEGNYEIKFIHAPRFYKIDDRVYYKESDSYYYFYFAGRLCRSQIAFYNTETKRKLPQIIEYADGNTYTWLYTTSNQGLTKEIVEGAEVEIETFKIISMEYAIPYNGFYEKLKAGGIEDDTIAKTFKKHKNYQVIAKEFLVYSQDNTVQSTDVIKEKKSLLSIVLSVIGPFLLEQALTTLIEFAILQEIAVIYTIITVAIVIQSFFSPPVKDYYDETSVISTVFPKFKIETLSQNNNGFEISVDRSGTNGYMIYWQKSQRSITNDPLTYYYNFFFDSLNALLEKYFSDIGINLHLIKNTVLNMLNDGLISKWIEIDESDRYRNYSIVEQKTYDYSFTDTEQMEYYRDFNTNKKEIEISCFFDCIDNDPNWDEYYNQSLNMVDDNLVVERSFYTNNRYIETSKVDYSSALEILNLQTNINNNLIPLSQTPFKIKREFNLAIGQKLGVDKICLVYSDTIDINLSFVDFFKGRSFIFNGIAVRNGFVRTSDFPFIYNRVYYMIPTVLGPYKNFPYQIDIRTSDIENSGTFYNFDNILDSDQLYTENNLFSYFYSPTTESAYSSSDFDNITFISPSAFTNFSPRRAEILYYQTTEGHGTYEKGILYLYNWNNKIEKYNYYMSYDGKLPMNEFLINNNEYNVPSNTVFYGGENLDLYKFVDFPKLSNGKVFNQPIVVPTDNKQIMFIFSSEGSLDLVNRNNGPAILDPVKRSTDYIYMKPSIEKIQTYAIEAFFEVILNGPTPRYYFINRRLRFKYVIVGRYYAMEQNNNIIFNSEQTIATRSNTVNLAKIQNSPFLPNKTYTVYQDNLEYYNTQIKTTITTDENCCINISDNFDFVYDYVHYIINKVSDFDLSSYSTIESLVFNPFISNEEINVSLESPITNGNYLVYEIISGDAKYEYEFFKTENVHINPLVFPFYNGTKQFNLNFTIPTFSETRYFTELNNFGWQFIMSIDSKDYLDPKCPYYYSEATGMYYYASKKINLSHMPIIIKNPSFNITNSALLSGTPAYGNFNIKFEYKNIDNSVVIQYHPSERFIPFIYGGNEVVLINNFNLKTLKAEQIYLKKSRYSDFCVIDTSVIKFFSYNGIEYTLIGDSNFIPFEVESYNLAYDKNFPSDFTNLSIYTNDNWQTVQANNIPKVKFIHERVEFDLTQVLNIPIVTKNIEVNFYGALNLSTRSLINIYDKNNNVKIIFSDKNFTTDDFPFIYNNVAYNSGVSDLVISSGSSTLSTYVFDPVKNSPYVLIHKLEISIKRENFPYISDGIKYILKDVSDIAVFIDYNISDDYPNFMFIGKFFPYSSIDVYSIYDIGKKTITINEDGFLDIFEFPFIYENKFYCIAPPEYNLEQNLVSYTSTVNINLDKYYLYNSGIFLLGKINSTFFPINSSHFPIYSNSTKYSINTQRDVVYVKSYTAQRYIYIEELLEINFTGNYSYYVNNIQITKFIRIRYGLVDKIYFTNNEFIYGDKKYILNELIDYDERKQCLRTKINGINGIVDYCYIDFKNKISYLFNENGTDKATRTNTDGGYLSLSLFPFFCNNVLYTLSNDYEIPIDYYVPSRSDVSLISFKLKPEDETPLSLLRNIYSNHNNYGLMHKGQFPFYYKGVRYMWQDLGLAENILIVPDDSTEINLPDFGTDEKLLVIQPYPKNITPPALTSNSVPSPIGTSITTGYRYHYYNTEPDDKAKTSNPNVSGGVIKEISNPPNVNDFPFYYNNKYYFLGEKDVDTTDKTVVLYSYYLEADNTIFSSNIQGTNSSNNSVNLTYDNLPLIVGDRFYHKGPNDYFEQKTYYVKNAVVGRNASRYYVSSTGMENFTPTGNVYTKFYPKEYNINGGRYFIYPGNVPNDFGDLGSNAIIKAMGYYTENLINRNLLKSDLLASTLNQMDKSFFGSFNGVNYSCQIRGVTPTTTIYYDRTRIIESVNNFTEELKLKHGSVPGHRGGSDDSVYYEGYFYKEKRLLTNATSQVSSLPETNTKIINFYSNQTSVFIEELSEIGMFGDIYNLNGWISINYFPFKYSGITYKLRLVAAEPRLIKIVSDRMIYNGISSPGPIPGTKYKNSTITSIQNTCNANFYSAHIETGERFHLSKKRTIDNEDITTKPYVHNGNTYTSSGDKLFVNGYQADLGDDGMIYGFKFRNKYISINEVDYAIDSFPIVIGGYQYDLSFVHTPRCVAVNSEIVANFKLTRTTDYFEEFITEYGTYYKERVYNPGNIMTPNIPIISERKKFVPLLKHKKYQIPLSRYGFVYEISGTRITGTVLFSFGNDQIFKEGTKIYRSGNSNVDYDETEICFINAGEEIFMDGFGAKPISEFPININGKIIDQIKLQISVSLSTFNFKDINLSNMIYKTSDKCHFIHDGKVYEYLIGSNPSYAITSPLYTDNNLVLPVSFLNQRSLLNEISVGSQIIKGDVLYTKVQNRVIIKINSKTTRINFITGYEINTEFEEVNNSEIPLIDKIFYSPSNDTIYTTEMDEIVNTQNLFFIDLTINNFLEHINYNDNELIQVDGILYNSRPLSLGNSNIYNKTEYTLSQIEKITSLEITTELTQYINVENLYSVDANTKLTQTQLWNGDKFIIGDFEITINNTLIFDEVIMDVIKSKKDIELNLGAYVIVDGKIKTSEKFYTIGNSKIVDILNRKIYSFNRIDDSFFAYEKIETYYSDAEFNGKTVYYLDGFTGSYTAGKPFIYDKILYSGFISTPVSSSESILPYGDRINFVSIAAKYDRIVIFSSNTQKDYEVNSNYIPSEYVPFIYNNVKYLFGYPNFYDSNQTIIISRNEVVQEIDLQFITGDVYEQNTHTISTGTGKISISKFPFINNDTLYEFEKLKSSFFTYTKTINLKIKEGIDPRSSLPNTDYYYKDDQRFDLNGELNFPMVINNTLYTLAKIPVEKFDYSRVETIHYRSGTKWINFDLSVIYQNNTEIEINRGFSPNGFSTESFVSAGIMYELIPYIEDSINETRVIKSNYTSGIHIGITGNIQLSTGFKKFVETTVPRDLFPFIYNQIEYQIEPLLISSEKVIYGIDTVSISKSADAVTIFYEDGKTGTTQMNNVGSNLFPFVYSGSKYVLSNDRPPYDKIDIIQVSHTNNGPISIEILDSHVYSVNGWIPKTQSYEQNIFPLISSGVKYTLAKLLPIDTVIRTKTVYVVGNSQNVETDIEETEIETSIGPITVNEGIIDRGKFPFVWRNTEYKLLEVYNSNYVIRETKEINYFYAETTVNLGFGQITVYYETNGTKILNSNDVPISEFPFIYGNVSYSTKLIENKTREGLEIKTEKLEINRYEYVNYKSIENLTLVTRKDSRFFRITDIYKPAKIITDNELIIIYM